MKQLWWFRTLDKSILDGVLSQSLFSPYSTTPDHMKDMDTDTIVREPMFNETNDYTARLYGFFVAPYDGPFKFYVASSDRVSLYFSNTSSPNDAMLIIDNCEGTK